MTEQGGVLLRSTERSDRILGIDTVRALAALSVVLAHIIAPELPRVLKNTALANTTIPYLAQYIFTGHPAVIAFFVVSGFCIHYPYVSKSLPILPFWIARWIRIIIPALFAMALAKLGRVSGYNFIDGYILWSIVCELIYYMVYPLFLFARRWVNWRGQFYIALILSFSIVIALGPVQYGTAHKYGPFLNWLVALPSWLAGCALAERVRNENSSLTQIQFPISFIRICVAVLASVLAWATMNTELGYNLTMNAFALVIYFWVYFEINSTKRTNSILEWIGKWSYLIYLLHMPLLLILNRIVSYAWGGGDVFLSLPIVLMGSYFLYKKVELPVHLYAREIFNSIKHRWCYPGHH